MSRYRKMCDQAARLNQAQSEVKLLLEIIDIAEKAYGVNNRKKFGAAVMNLLQRDKHSLSLPCKLLGYSRQAFYKSIKTHESDLILDELIITEVFTISKTQPKVGQETFYFTG